MSAAALPTDSRLAALCAQAAYAAARDYQARFHAISQRAPRRFLARDWAGMHADAAERLRLYGAVLDPLVAAVRGLMGERLGDRALWTATKAVYSSRIADCQEWEIGESFFNSLTRRVFATVGVDQQVEFVDTDFDAPPTAPREPAHRRFAGAPPEELVGRALTAASGFESPAFARLAGDARAAAGRLAAELGEAPAALEIAPDLFYRGRGAYLVGRALGPGGAVLPFALALRHEDGASGVHVDAAMCGENPLAILFSFTRSHFHADVKRPYELVRFLGELMPRKRLSDLYTSIGFSKHGKTELYRDLVRHLRASDDRFAPAEGTRGMVMLVFTLPSYEVVFKLIRDQFDYPKDATRRDVMDKYRLVFEHDRAGRLMDAHEFEQVRLPAARFDPALLAELRAHATQSVSFDDGHVVLRHAYLERRVRPLNLHLVEAVTEDARAAAADYGRCIKDLARMNIFTGDLLPKNFGVTRHGRVVFYDYDELCWLLDCRFREIPEARTPEQEMAAEPWYSVRANDVFPEEFPRFLGLSDELMAELTARHGDVFEAAAWRSVQEALRAGEEFEVLPYDEAERLRAVPAGAGDEAPQA